MMTHVPTAAELVPLGEAVPLGGNAYRVTPAGHARMGEALRRRAEDPEPTYRERVIAARARANEAEK